MTSPTVTNNLATQLAGIGLNATSESLEDFIARATKGRWSPRVMLEELLQAEARERGRRSLERRLKRSRIGRFKPLADFDWNWPKKIDRQVIERALALDFIPDGRNFVLLGANGLGKTMITKNIAHAAVLAGWNEVFPNAACIATLLDRLTHHADVTVIEGRSYRIRESEQEASARRKKKG